MENWQTIFLGVKQLPRGALNLFMNDKGRYHSRPAPFLLEQISA
jgi:hypothetical protein